MGGAAATAAASTTFSINVGPAFIKFFQIVEILGKLYFTPIKYSNLLDYFLSTIYGFSDLIQMPISFILGQDPREETASIGKLTKNSIPRNILRSTPLFVPIHLFLTLLLVMLNMLDKKVNGVARYQGHKVVYREGK